MKRARNKRNRKLLIIVPVFVAVIAAASISAVFAFSRSRSLVNNELEANGTSVQIIEDSEAGFGRKNISFYSNSIQNTPVLLRIAYSETWTKADGTIVSNVYYDGSNYVNAVLKSWTTDFTNDFVDGGDGWYYYEKTLAPLQTVQVLQSIALNNNDYAIYNYDLSFRFEAIQADADAASSLWGKTVTVGNDGTVTWTF